MKALFFIIAILCSLAGAYYAYDNTNKLTEQQDITKNTERQKLNVQATLKKNQEKLKDLNTNIKSTEQAIADASAALEAAKAKEGTLKKTLTKYEAELLTIEEELEGFRELQRQIKEALATVGVTEVGEIPDMIEELKKNVQEKEDDLNNMELIITKLQEEVARNKESKTSANERLSGIKENIAQNAMTATVTSVNTQWGFVVINKGSSNSPITEDAELLVQRYGKYVGKLKVATLESNQTVCDLDLAGFRGGSLPRPGDRVILRETTKR